MAKDELLRRQLVELLSGGHAHATFEQAVRNFPLDKIGIRPAGTPHSAWELLEHMRIAQEDILRFSQSADWVSPKWPEGYWPASASPERENQWRSAIRAFKRDLAELAAMIEDPARKLDRPFPWGDGQTLLREALLTADHNAYHLGQLVMARQLLGIWPK